MQVPAQSASSCLEHLPADAPTHRAGLYVAPTTIAGLQQQRGLFTARSIRAGEFIGFFTGEVLTDDEYDERAPVWRAEADRYTMGFSGALFNYVVSPVAPGAHAVDAVRHPMSLANEPPRAP